MRQDHHATPLPRAPQPRAPQPPPPPTPSRPATDGTGGRDGTGGWRRRGRDPREAERIRRAQQAKTALKADQLARPGAYWTGETLPVEWLDDLIDALRAGTLTLEAGQFLYREVPRSRLREMLIARQRATEAQLHQLWTARVADGWRTPSAEILAVQAQRDWYAAQLTAVRLLDAQAQAQAPGGAAQP